MGVESNLLIVGLAPGRHGANRTGRPFTGDASGDLLFRTLTELGLADRVKITNAVKCLPVRNRPIGEEVNNCQVWLQDELATLFEQGASYEKVDTFRLGTLGFELQRCNVFKRRV